jgi:hypothetical protein
MMTIKNQQHGQHRASMMAAIDIIEMIKKDKKDIEKIAINPVFSESFFEIFQVGSFSSKDITETSGVFKVAMEPFVNNSWRAVFFIKGAVDSSGAAYWRHASVLEIVSCWGNYYPLLKKLLQSDKENTSHVINIIDKLTDDLAPEIIAKHFDSSADFLPKSQSP